MTTPGAQRSANQDASAKASHFPRSVLSDQITFSTLRDNPAHQSLALAEVTADQEEVSFRWIAPFCGQRPFHFSPPAGRQILFATSASDAYFNPRNISAMHSPLEPNGLISPFAVLPPSNPINHYHPVHSTYDDPAWLSEESSCFPDASDLPPIMQFEQFSTGDHLVLGTSHATAVRDIEDSTAVLDDYTIGAHTSPNLFVRSAAIQQETGNSVLKPFEILRSSWLPSPSPLLHWNKNLTRKRQASTEINGAKAAKDVKKAKKAKKAEKAEMASKSEKPQKESAAASGELTTDESAYDDGITVSILTQMFGTTEAVTNKPQPAKTAVELKLDRRSHQPQHVTVGAVDAVKRKPGRPKKVQLQQTGENDTTQSQPAQSRAISGQSCRAIRATRGTTTELFATPLKRASSMPSGRIISDSTTTELTMIAETLAKMAIAKLLETPKANSSTTSNNRFTATVKRDQAPDELVQPFVVSSRFGALKRVPLLFWVVFTLQRLPDPTTWVHIESFAAAMSIVRCTLTKKQTIAGTISTDRKDQATSTIESSGTGYYRLKSELRPGHPVTEHWLCVLEKYQWTTA